MIEFIIKMHPKCIQEAIQSAFKMQFQRIVLLRVFVPIEISLSFYCFHSCDGLPADGSNRPIDAKRENPSIFSPENKNRHPFGFDLRTRRFFATVSPGITNSVLLQSLLVDRRPQRLVIISKEIFQ